MVNLATDPVCIIRTLIMATLNDLLGVAYAAINLACLLPTNKSGTGVSSRLLLKSNGGTVLELS